MNMNLVETLKKMRNNNPSSFSGLLERMYRKADKGLLEYSRHDIDMALKNIDAVSKNTPSKKSFLLEIAELEECLKKYENYFNEEALTEAVTYIDNAGNLKTTSAVDYNKSTHEYNTETQIREYKKKLKKEYNLVEDTDLSLAVEDILKMEANDGK